MEKKKLTERKRKARIRANPKLYEALLLRERERAAKNFIPLKQLPPKQMAIKRKRIKEYNRLYYRKLTRKRKTEVTDPEKCTLLGL